MTYADIDYVDEQDALVGSGPLQDAWEAGYIHRIARVFVFNTQGEMLLQKRSAHVLSPHKWDNSAAGHVDTGETYLEAAIREAYEEIGLKDVLLREVVKFYKEDTYADGYTTRRFNMLYDAIYDGAIDFDPHEVSEVRWISRDKLEEWILTTPEDFTPDFIYTYELYKKAGR